MHDIHPPLWDVLIFTRKWELFLILTKNENFFSEMRTFFSFLTKTENFFLIFNQKLELFLISTQKWKLFFSFLSKNENFFLVFTRKWEYFSHFKWELFLILKWKWEHFLPLLQLIRCFYPLIHSFWISYKVDIKLQWIQEYFFLKKYFIKHQVPYHTAKEWPRSCSLCEKRVMTRKKVNKHHVSYHISK